MDNPLTPNKIQRLMHLAEDKPFNMTMPRRLLLNDEDLKRLASHQLAQDKSSTNYESSSGILDLEKVEGFGESDIGNLSLSKSTAFNPGEMTGRSTGTGETNSNVGQNSMGVSGLRLCENYNRHSIALDSITSEMDKQTSEVKDILRHSIATNYSFHSKRDLTADEASLMLREAPLPQQQQSHFIESMSINSSSLSVGTYFKNRCSEFGKMLEKTDSPDRSMRPSITDVSSNTYSGDPAGSSDLIGKSTDMYNINQTLDSVPVKLPRSTNTETIPPKQFINNLSNIKTFEKANNNDPVNPVNQNTYTIKSDVKLDNVPTNKVPDVQKNLPTNKVPDTRKNAPMSSNMTLNLDASHKHLMNSMVKPADIILKKHQSSWRIATDDTESSIDNSFSISKIADYLGKQSNISVTDMMQLNKHNKKMNKKQPLTELHMNAQENRIDRDVQVTYLKDVKNMPAASSAGSVDTVICLDKLKINEDTKCIPTVIVNNIHSNDIENIELENVKEKRRSTRSKSPSSKSQSTLSTVQENYVSFKSNESPVQAINGEANTSYVPSPNVEYKELDRSVNWHEMLQHRHLKHQYLAKEQWAEILTTTTNGFVGVTCPVTLTITTITESWLTAKFQFDELPNNGSDLTVEVPRIPLLLSPGKSEQFTVYLTSNIEINESLPFTIFLKDASIEDGMEQKGNVRINIKMPTIETMSSDGVNKVTFPPTQEKSSLTKSFVLMSECSEDLQLDLTVSEGDSMFLIKNVQEIKKSDVNKVLIDCQGSQEEAQQGVKSKFKAMNKQLCRLTRGNAIKVTITFTAPLLSEIQLNNLATFHGALNVNLIGVKTVLKKVNLIGTVGSVNLILNTPIGNKLQLSNEMTTITVSNTGSIPGMWIVKFKSNMASNSNFPFKISPSKFDIRPGATKTINLSYTGPDDNVYDAIVMFEDVATGKKTLINVTGGSDKPKAFPIKTNYNVMSWVRAGRKELSLKNSTNKKVHIKCQIVGEGFSIDMPGVESRGSYILPFGPNECRPLSVIFTPNSAVPHAALLYLMYDKTSEFTRKIAMCGCAGGEGVRWRGPVTCGHTALIRASPGDSVSLPLYNRAAAPAFVLAKVHFNLQFTCAAQSARLEGAASVVAARGAHEVRLVLPPPLWSRLERRARDRAAAAAGASPALATVTLLTGAETTRRRILKVLKDEGKNGELDISLLPEHLRVLAVQFEGEDPTIDNYLADFEESKSSLDELIGGLQELTAQIDLPQDFADENTIIISDDTMIEHHTLYN
ncbi:uncharacterized protein LOC113516193 isoform X2 [Galleria mellonella]|uniref:Uncharacterized protein LOC113516193 isoform X2 n=1 Tax=Galleria mellonella TaxID=7137 RepID=A0ABM3MZZ5_GALME|nr:uncharacterized protein LOC113516193 isoform X2 [Galleria mellonella]